MKNSKTYIKSMKARIKQVTQNLEDRIKEVNKVSAIFSDVKFVDHQAFTNLIKPELAQIKFYNSNSYLEAISANLTYNIGKSIFIIKLTKNYKHLDNDKMITITSEKIILHDCFLYTKPYDQFLNEKFLVKIRTKILRMIERYPNHNLVIKGKNNPFNSLKAFV